MHQPSLQISMFSASASPSPSAAKAPSCLTLVRLPARLDVSQTAEVLGFQPHDIAILVAGKLLKPLGRPAANSIRYFATVFIFQLSQDPEWLDKATRIISQHWRKKNQKVRRKSTGLSGDSGGEM
jgi:hypothetical protein